MWIGRAVAARRGFTLIELMVALVVTAILALMTHQIFATVTDTARRLEAVTAREDSLRNGDRWLRQAFLSLEAGGEAGSFEGHADRVSFAAWLETPDGWKERCRVEVAVLGTALRASACSTSFALRSGVENVAFDYLLEPGADTRWVRDWVSPVSAPLAVRVRIASIRVGHDPSEGGAEVDTLLLLIKGRG
ncbi:MAG: type II secretion system protein J [Gemmatimonadales bacterium]